MGFVPCLHSCFYFPIRKTVKLMVWSDEMFRWSISILDKFLLKLNKENMIYVEEENNIRYGVEFHYRCNNSLSIATSVH